MNINILFKIYPNKGNETLAMKNFFPASVLPDLVSTSTGFINSIYSENY